MTQLKNRLNAPPKTYRKDARITDAQFPGLELTPQQIFGKARLPEETG